MTNELLLPVAAIASRDATQSPRRDEPFREVARKAEQVAREHAEREAERRALEVARVRFDLD